MGRLLSASWRKTVGKVTMAAAARSGNGRGRPGLPGQAYATKEGGPLTPSERGRALRPAVPMNPKGKKSVLVIDDEESFCAFVDCALRKTGRYTVTSATKPLQGVTMARTLRPDLILLDVTMPQMAGAQVAERLLENAKTKSIPIVFVTGLVTNEETKHQEMTVAGRTLIAKPVTAPELLQALGRILN